MDKSEWPPRPDGEVFPEILDVTLVAQLLCYDRRGCTPENGRRSVRGLVKENGLPAMGKVGGRYLFSRAAVTDWLSNRNESLEDAGHDG